jgi:hypothetical protein
LKDLQKNLETKYEYVETTKYFEVVEVEIPTEEEILLKVMWCKMVRVIE